MRSAPVHDGPFADPFVLAVDGGYVAYGTGRVVGGRAFEVLRSPDLRTWTTAGGALEPLPDGWATDYWAPEVWRADDGRFVMHYSVGTGERGHRIRTAVADRPEGPFTDSGRVLTPDERFAIDPSPFRDVDGARYLYFAHDVLDGDRPGTTIAVAPLDDDGLRLGGPARTLLRATADWQRYQADRPMYGARHDWHTLEGPFVVRRGGRYVLFYSGGNWQDHTYGVSYAVADHPLGPFHEPEPGPAVLRTRRGLTGPGHCSVVVGPDGGDRLAFHAWDAAAERREFHIAPLEWTADGPRVSP